MRWKVRRQPRPQPPGLAGDDRSAALQEAGDRRGLFDDRYPDIQAGGAMTGDAVLGQRLEEQEAPRCVDASRVLEPLLHRRVGPQVGDDLLEDVANPAGAEQLAPLDAGDRYPIAGHEREAEVGSERL